MLFFGNIHCRCYLWYSSLRRHAKDIIRSNSSLLSVRTVIIGAALGTVYADDYYQVGVYGDWTG
jgi:hypothetical protein